MNAKLCKKLRQLARAITNTKGHERGLHVTMRTNKLLGSIEIAEGVHAPVYAEVRVNAPGTYRSTYRHLKKKVRRGA